MNIRKLYEIIEDVFAVEADEIKPEMSLEDDLFADEEDFEELSFIFEEEFGIEPDAESIAECKTVSDLSSYIERESTDYD